MPPVFQPHFLMPLQEYGSSNQDAITLADRTPRVYDDGIPVPGWNTAR
jgi:hypothetical protein